MRNENGALRDKPTENYLRTLQVAQLYTAV